MTMSVINKILNQGTTALTTAGFRQAWLDHYSVDPSLYKGESHAITPRLANKYIGDFYGLLSELEVQKDLFWFILIINNLYSPQDFNGDIKTIYQVNRPALISLLDRYLSTLARL